jgi:hypothetical protein
MTGLLVSSEREEITVKMEQSLLQKQGIPFGFKVAGSAYAAIDRGAINLG